MENRVLQQYRFALNQSYPVETDSFWSVCSESGSLRALKLVVWQFAETTGYRVRTPRPQAGEGLRSTRTRVRL
jgi:hypothetical protein